MMYQKWLVQMNQPLLVFAIAFIVIWLVHKWLQYRKIPPGPCGLPIVGYFPFLTKDPHLVFIDLAKRYGDIFSVKVGVTDFVVINESNMAKKILNHPATFARPPERRNFFPGKGGFGSYNGPEWVEQRRFCVIAMKDLGLGRGEWESMIHEEADDFVTEIRNWKGKPTDYLRNLESTMTGNILSLLIGRRLPKDRSHPEWAVFVNFIRQFMPNTAVTGFATNMPLTFLKILKFLKIGSFEKIMKITSDFEQLIRKEINKNMTSTNIDQKPNFLTKYLQELEKQATNEKAHSFGIDSLVGNIGNLFIGGADTVKVSLHWMLLLMAAYPEIQKKVQEEIEDVVGKDRTVYWEDHNKLPYTMATINELERWAAIVPLSPTRWTLDTVEIGGYTIPKGTAITVNFWSLMHNKNYCTDPDVFKPERFLSDNKLSTKLEGYMPFSVGKRNCPGEHVAMMTMFLYFTAIMQNFRVACPHGKPELFKVTEEGMLRNALPQELCFVER